VSEDRLVSRLRGIHNFAQLKNFLADEMGWPIQDLDIEDLTFDYDPAELGIKPRHAAKIKVVKRLRSLSADQPWGIFFVEFEKKNLSVEVLRRILGHVVVKRRGSRAPSDHATWSADDLLFISNYGDASERRISFAQFSEGSGRNGLARLKVVAWDASDAMLHLNEVARNLTECLSWPEDESDTALWRARWRQAFQLEYREIIATSESLAVRLAGLARVIRDRMIEILNSETDTGPFQKLMKGFKETLVEDLDEPRFADMYAQTITYGLLSARISGANLSSHKDFVLHLHASPFLRELMEAFLTAGGSSGRRANIGIDFDELGIQDVIDALNASKMEDIVRNFGDKNFSEDPVTHFYETFLAKYDPKLRVQRGVFYTPQAVVKIIVRSVHLELIEAHGIIDGLASDCKIGQLLRGRGKARQTPEETSNEFLVNILDPATGTGTFLVEIIELIYQTLLSRWMAEGLSEAQIAKNWNEYVPIKLLPRIFGYELLMAPYAVAHLKISLKLIETGYQFREDDRINIFLTNALSGPQDFDVKFDFVIPALDHEARAVNEIKKTKRFSVVVGNPPYSGISSNMSDEARKSIEPYKYIDGEHFGEKKHWLQDDYVKFVRLAEVLIEHNGFGVIGLITNHAFLDNPTFRGMRWHLLNTFDRLFVLDLHGNVMKQEAPPFGQRNENVFDIQQGVAIGLFSKYLDRSGSSTCYFGELWGTRSEKYDRLRSKVVTELAQDEVVPESKFYFFCPHDASLSPEYSRWPQISDAFGVFAGGFITARDHFVVDTDKEALLKRIADLRSKKLTDSQIRSKYFEGMGSDKYPDGDTRGWKLSSARESLRRDRNWRENVKTCVYRPFDLRFVYWTDYMVDWPRPETNGHLLNEGNIGLVFMRQVVTSSDYTHVMVSRQPVDARACYSNKGIMSLAPLFLHSGSTSKSHTLFSDGDDRVSNLTPSFVSKFEHLVESKSSDPEVEIFNYVVAVLSSPKFRSRYVALLKIDFPRIPVPITRRLFSRLSKLGSQLIKLQLLEEKVPRGEMPKFFGSRTTVVGRIAHVDEVLWIDTNSNGAASGTTGFEGVSEKVYKFEIGGYQVCEKWFKDRRGRVLTSEEIDHVRLMITSISRIMKLQVEIDRAVTVEGGFPAAFI